MPSRKRIAYDDSSQPQKRKRQAADDEPYSQNTVQPIESPIIPPTADPDSSDRLTTPPSGPDGVWSAFGAVKRSSIDAESSENSPSDFGPHLAAAASLSSTVGGSSLPDRHKGVTDAVNMFDLAADRRSDGPGLYIERTVTMTTETEPSPHKPPEVLGDGNACSPEENEKTTPVVIRSPASYKALPSLIDNNHMACSSVVAGTGQQIAFAPKYQPLAHEPILPGEFGHGRVKSRLTFEADFCPFEERYKLSVSSWSTATMESAPVFHRMSATEKFHEWRNKSKISKLKDGDIRRNERLVVLVEHEPCGPQGEAERWGDAMKNMEKWVKKLMPDSYIVIQTSIPANRFTANGGFRYYVDAIRYLLRTHPHHFSVELEDESVLDADVSTFYPTSADHAYNADIQGSVLSLDRVCHIKGVDNEAALRQLAEDQESSQRQAEQERLGVKNLPIDYVWIDKWKNDTYNQWKMEIIATLPDKLASKCRQIDEEFAYVRQFVSDIQHFHDYGVLPGETAQPFKSMKPVSKSKYTGPVYKGPGARREDPIDAVAEAKNIVSVLPWISEERALKHMQKVVEIKGATPGSEYSPLEVAEEDVGDNVPP